jgi:pimeloyl-ACP methyl ester carboxylesterase
MEVQYRAVDVLTPDGVRIAAQEWGAGPASDLPPVLFLHGYSQSHGAWLKQVSSPLIAGHRLITYDLRGHGDSDKPSQPHFYREAERWAGEVQSVLDTLGLERPIVVAWSYAGRVILDYLSVFGDGRLGGLVLVDASSSADPGLLGPAGQFLRRMTDPDPAISEQATRELLRACVAQQLPDQEFDYMLDYNLRVPASIRANMIGRPAAYQTVLEAAQLPALIVHGARDPINLPAMAQFTVRSLRGARLALYEDAAHMPFWESPARFNAELEQFVRTAWGGGT